jgi:hypothetical protein
MASEQNQENIIICLSSCTVFWADLGADSTQMTKLRSDRVRFDRFSDRILQWLGANITGPWTPHYDGVWFLDPKDACLFKMFWYDCELT